MEMVRLSFFESVVLPMGFVKVCLYGIGTSFLQLFVTMLATVLYGFAGLLLMPVFVKLPNADLLDAVVASILMFGFYGAAWWLFWFLNVGNGDLQYFKTKVICGTLPILGYFYMYKPRVDIKTPQMIEITLPDQFTFGLLVSAVVLFPLFSLGLVRYVLADGQKKVRNGLVLICVLLLVGGLCFYAGWRMMPMFYPEVQAVPFPL